MKFITALGIGLLTAFLYTGCKARTDEPNQPKDKTYDVAPTKKRNVDWQKKSLAMVLDTSGSMENKIEGKRKIDSAKESLQGILKRLQQSQQAYQKENPNKYNIEAGLFYFDGRTVKCAVPISKLNYNQLSTAVDSMTANGGTPLGIALAYAERSLNTNATGRKYILMLTDGENSTGRSPEKVYTKIKEANTKSQDPTNLFMAAFATSKTPFADLEKQGAKVVEAKDAEALQRELDQYTTVFLEAPE